MFIVSVLFSFSITELSLNEMISDQHLTSDVYATDISKGWFVLLIEYDLVSFIGVDDVHSSGLIAVVVDVYWHWRFRRCSGDCLEKNMVALHFLKT